MKFVVASIPGKFHKLVDLNNNIRRSVAWSEWTVGPVKMQKQSYLKCVIWSTATVPWVGYCEVLTYIAKVDGLVCWNGECLFKF